MKPSAPIIEADGEIRTLSAADMQLFKPTLEVLPLVLYKELLVMNKVTKEASRLKKPNN